MDNLQKIIHLFDTVSVKFESEIYLLEFVANDESKKIVEFLYEEGCIEEISSQGKVIETTEINSTYPIKVEISVFRLKKICFYHDMESLVNDNLLFAPVTFYVYSEKCLYPENTENKSISSYLAIVNLIDCLSSLAAYKSEESLYILQDKSGVAVPLLYSKILTEGQQPNLENISSFTNTINTHTEKKKIFTKELIDFLSLENDENGRLSYLFMKFDQFHAQYEAAYTFFLSDFSYSKLKLELESAILDYSKNIRAIINDSQTKLIAIPAAFLVASTQLDLDNVYLVKNFLIVVTSYIFSILIEIFIRNQESALKIFEDNIRSYKTTFIIKNNNTETNYKSTLQSIISDGFSAIDLELSNQRKRLILIRWINWSVSSFVAIILLILISLSLIPNHYFTSVAVSTIMFILRLV